MLFKQTGGSSLSRLFVSSSQFWSSFSNRSYSLKLRNATFPFSFSRILSGKKNHRDSLVNPFLSAFTGFLAVYVSASMCNPNKPCNELEKLAATQIISSALYGTLICLLICVALNWLMDMENQFKLMLIIQLILTIPCGFLMWWILGWQIAYVAAM